MIYSGKFKATLDACVLYPAPIRDLLLWLADGELYTNATNYSTLIGTLKLPDQDDRHVLAAAIRSSSDVIVTLNLKDFPGDVVRTHDIEVQTPDYFISNIIDLNEKAALRAFQNQVQNLKNPPQSAEQVLDTLENNGLKVTVKKLRVLLANKE